MFRYDMHCHTKEGSLDAKVPVEEYAARLMSLGYSGMVITDHDSYDGYRAWMDSDMRAVAERAGFYVLKGIEYDSRNGGHVLVILPDGTDLPVLEHRGMGVSRLVRMVHRAGGIVGAAHPFGPGWFAITNTGFYRRHHSFIKKFDFIEVQNSGIKQWQNGMARCLASAWDKPMTGGSDSHHMDHVGTACTDFKTEIRCCNDLISYIKSGKPVRPGGKRIHDLYTRRSPVFQAVLNGGYLVWNYFLAVVNIPFRIKAVTEEKKNREK